MFIITATWSYNTWFTIICVNNKHAATAAWLTRIFFAYQVVRTRLITAMCALWVAHIIEQESKRVAVPNEMISQIIILECKGVINFIQPPFNVLDQIIIIIIKHARVHGATTERCSGVAGEKFEGWRVQFIFKIIRIIIIRGWDAGRWPIGWRSHNKNCNLRNIFARPTLCVSLCTCALLCVEVLRWA